MSSSGGVGLVHHGSVVVHRPAQELYDMVSDVTRTGEWSPVCTSCWWDDVAQAGQVGAWFTGRNVLPHRTWETRSVVVAADAGREFAWVVGGNLARWGFLLAPTGSSTVLTETWELLPDGVRMATKKYGDQASTEIADRREQALTGIPATLAAIARIAGS